MLTQSSTHEVSIAEHTLSQRIALAHNGSWVVVSYVEQKHTMKAVTQSHKPMFTMKEIQL